MTRSLSNGWICVCLGTTLEIISRLGGQVEIFQNGSNKNPGGGQAEHNLETEFGNDNNPWFSLSVSCAHEQRPRK